ncbi:Hypothetical predicted protein [Paramuricea clavata]|uniref:Uncharacterized protein n=1 Tax=Paramuricea clavata TaxID=317549 RepID=A0A6S7IT85_PARCT|nr:Hypothetical predicted protein [Paramuricea clavata]
MSFLSALLKIFEDGGLKGVLRGKQYNRSVFCHKIAYKAIQRLHFKAFLENLTDGEKEDRIIELAVICQMPFMTKSTSTKEIPHDSEFKWIVVEPGTGDFVVIKPRQAKGVSSHPDSSTNEERPAIDEQQVGTDPADSYLFSCPEDSCIKSYMSHGHLQQQLMYGRQFSTKPEFPLLDRAKISYADPLEEERGGQSLITMSTEVGTTSVSEGWAGRDPKRTGHQFSAKQRTFLENKFNNGVKTGVKANPDNVSKEMRQLKDQNGKQVFTVVEFLRH